MKQFLKDIWKAACQLDLSAKIALVTCFTTFAILMKVSDLFRDFVYFTIMVVLIFCGIALVILAINVCMLAIGDFVENYKNIKKERSK